MEGCLVKALYDFPKEADTDLNLQVGDVIKVTERINDDWYYGINKDKTGQFPSGFVEIVLENATERVFLAIADFVAKVDEDINIVKDEYVALVEDIDENWFKGRTKKSKGLCPKSFVKEVYFLSTEAVRNDKKDIVQKQQIEDLPYGESVDSFNAQDGDELSFPKGVRIELTKEIDSFWTEGVYNGQKGKFPSLFVKVIKPLPESLRFKENDAENDKEKPSPNAKALFMYVGSGADELNFDKGDVITLTERINNEWLKGKIGNTEGIFPTSFVQIIVDFPFEEANNNTKSQKKILVNEVLTTTSAVNQTPSNTTTSRAAGSKNTIINTQKQGTQKPDKGHAKKPNLKPKPSIKQKPALPQANTSKDYKPAPLLLTSRKQQSKPSNATSSVEQSVADSSEVKTSANVSEKPNKAPTIIKASKGKPVPTQLSPKPTQKKPDVASKPLVPTSLRQEANSGSPQPQARSAGKRKPVQTVTIDHSLPLLQDTKVTSKLNRPARPSGQTPSPNTKLLEEELNSNALIPKTKDIGISNSTFYISENDTNISPVNINAPSNGKPVSVTKKQAPKRPSKCPSRSSSTLPNSRNDGQMSPKLPPSAPPKVQPRVVKQGSNLQSQKQNGGAPVEKSRTLPPRLPKPLAPLPPQKPVVPRSPKPSHVENAASEADLKSPTAQFTENGKFYVPSVSGSQGIIEEKSSREKRNSLFYTDAVDNANGHKGKNELESVEKRIVQIRGQIESEANMLSGIETLLEVSEDECKKTELLSKRRSLSVSLIDLDEELNACQDEKSYLLASYGDVAAIKNRIKELSELIDQYQDNSAKLRKLKDVANIDELAEIRDGIEFCDNMIETLLEEISSLKTEMEKKEPAVREPVKEDPAETRRKLLHQRQQAISELIKTEKDYVRDISLCSTKILNQLKESKDIDCEVLFGNLAVISDISKKLLESFDGIEQEQDPEKSAVKQIGQSFTELSFDLKSEYSCYCRNYDESQVYLEKLEQDQEKREEILAAVASVREETGLWDLSSFLIKPVQRILKYPLILQEIFKFSPDDDEDRGCIQDAIKILKNVANAINEFKRRKDLVQKYQRDEGIGNRIQRLNWHSVRKKSSRINQKITQYTGLVAQTVDETFNEEEKRFKDVEKMIKSFVRNLSLYLEYFQENCNLQINVAEDVKAFCQEAPNLDEVDSICNVILKIRDALCPEFISFVKTRVFDPLENLLQLFQSPTRLIEKRQDKCLDYDRLLNRVQKLKEKEKQKQANEELALSRKIYQALNSQLLEELPRLSEKCLKFFDFCLANLVQARCAYLQKVTEDLKLCLQFHLIERCSTAEVIQRHEKALSIAEEKLAQLVFYPERSLPAEGSVRPDTSTLPREPASNFYIDLLYDPNEGDPTSPIKPVTGDKTDGNDADMDKPKPLPRRKSIRRGSHPSSVSPLPSSPTKAFDSSEVRKHVNQPPIDNNTYVADFTFEKENDAEISMEEGNIVNVLRKCDKEGNSEWWLIETSNGRGYVPALYLSPYNNPVDRPGNNAADGTNKGFIQSQDLPNVLGTVSKEKLSPVPSTANRRFSTDFSIERQPEIPNYNKEPWNNTADNTTTSKGDSILYKALYDFEAEEGECSLEEGAIVRLMKLGDLSGNTEWSQIEYNGKSGYVPTNYLEQI